jgi:TolB-like protein/tetratricopeptide (TPR) repeat protein
VTPERWQHLKEVLEGAWERDARERDGFLDEACAGDAELRSRVEALLASDVNAGEFLAATAMDVSETGGAALAHAIEGLPDGDLTGTRVGRYTIQGLIGKGGMGAVYRAVREDDFRMQVAIKLLNRGTDTAVALRRFRAERQILAGLQHPNIARLLDGGATEAGLPYFVMEYVDGTPLLEYAAPLPVRRRLELFRQVCEAVQHAHRNLIVHRDIKPANLLVTREGIPKLLDFGIAKLVDPAADGSTTGRTGADGHLMTPGYASPEQVRGEAVTTATDIYSLGAVLYELLTGRRAHTLENYSAEEIEKEICTREPRKPSTVVKELDGDLDNIAMMALRKEPERRYGSAAEFSEDLDRFLRNLPVQARKESMPYRSRKFLKRNRVAVTAAVLSAAVVLGLVAGVGRFQGSRGAADGGRGIAVLPLENLSGDREQEYFADGMTDALISDLARIPALRVISRTSAMSFKGVHRPLPEIARSLGVQTIAEGSVLRSGNRMRIAVRLVDARSDRPVWSGSYEGEPGEVLSLQREVVEAIASEIHVTLTASNRARISPDRKINLGAYDAYLKGRRQYLTDFTLDSVQKAIGYFHQALAVDPGYAPAYAGLADCYYTASNVYYPPTEAMPKAKRAALKALELDDTLADAQASLALIRSVYDFDRAAAEQGFRRALDLRPSDAQAHLWYGIHLAGVGRFDEAVREVGRAQQLDPVSPATNTYIGFPLYFAHRYDEAIQRMLPLIEMYPDYNPVHAVLALSYEQKGEWSKAIAEMERAYELDKESESEGLAQLGHIYATAGRTADARRVLGQLKELSGKRYVSAYNMGVLYAGLGERDEAFRWLEKVEEDRSEWFALINVDPRLDGLHGDARFAGILRRVGLGK